MFSSCQDAVAVAKACDLQQNWQTFMLSMYRQVIQQHNIDYMQTMHALSIVSLPAQAFEQLSAQFKKDPGRAKHVHAFRATMHLFLERVVTNLKDVDVVLNSVADDRELTAMGLDGVKTVTYERLDV